jgi:SHS2 domain-containing protein
MENLLYNFLEDFIFLLDSEDYLVSRIKEIEIDKENFSLNATLTGDKRRKIRFYK